jgi:RNA polymerase sigma-70 factor (ECF subfamily)
MSPLADPRADDELVRAVAAGDEDALATLYDRHAGWLSVRLSRRCARTEVVDCAVQDTFLAVWRNPGAYRGDGDVAAYLWGIGVRRLIDAIRRDSGARRWLPWRSGCSGSPREP